MFARACKFFLPILAVLLGACVRKPAGRSWQAYLNPYHRSVVEDRVVVQGTVAPGWERVRDEFQASFDEGREGTAAQVGVYHHGKLVVDLWASHETPQGDEAGGSAVGVIFSCTKVAESLVMAMLADRGLISFDEPISAYWPEFAQTGKESITVAQLMRHQAGLAGPDEPITLEIIADPPRLGRLLARQAPNWPMGPAAMPRQLYHAVSRGYYASEICRRVDPKGRTLGEFFRQEVAELLGLQFYIGIKEEERRRQSIMALEAPPISLLAKYVMQYVLPTESMRTAILGPDEMHDLILDFEAGHVWGVIARTLRLDFDVNWILVRSLTRSLSGLASLQDANAPHVQAVELPSAGGLANARSMAKIAAVMADRTGDSSLLSKAGRALALATHLTLRDEGLGYNVTYTAAGWGQGRFGQWGFPQYYGWAGAAGAMLQWSESDEIGFAYLPTMSYARVHKPRGLRLLRAVQACKEAQHESR